MKNLILIGGLGIAAYCLLKKKKVVEPGITPVPQAVDPEMPPGMEGFGQFGPRYIYAPGLRWGK